jgi:cytoskeletal protein CcmA (bactofilin family)
MKYFLNHLQDESGVALVTGLVIMVLLTAIGTYAIHMTEIDETIAGNLKTSKQAFYVAEAGIQHAKTFLNQNKGKWGDYAYATLDDAKATPLIPSTQLSTMGTYTVTIQDAGNNARSIRSTGTTASNASAVIENLVRLGPFNPGKALTVGGDLTVSGSAAVNGGLHTNGDLDINGNPTITGGATATGTCQTPCIQGQSAVTIPPINPANFKGKQDFRLAADGTVYNSSDVALTAPGATWEGWDYNNGTGTWTMNSNTTKDATLYIEGNVKISGGPGSTETPWIATIIATGSIEVTGHPTIRPPLASETSLFHSGTENLLFVAGKDLNISGNSTVSLEGILAAHEQVYVSGSTVLKGFVIAEDAAATVKEDTVGGNMILNYQDNLNNPFPGDVQVMSWELGS